METDVVVVGAGPTGLGSGMRAAGRRYRGAGARQAPRAGGDIACPWSAAARRRGARPTRRARRPAPTCAADQQGRRSTSRAASWLGCRSEWSMERLGGRTGLIISQAEIEGSYASDWPNSAEQSSGDVASPRSTPDADGVSVRLDDGSEDRCRLGDRGGRCPQRRPQGVQRRVSRACRSSSGFCSPTCMPTWTGHAMRHRCGCAEPSCWPRSRCPARTCGG